MNLSPEGTFGATIAVMALDFGIFQLGMPTTADIKSTDPHNQAINSSRMASVWTAVAATSALSLLARKPEIFIFGAGFAVILDWHYRHANAVAPGTGQVTIPPVGGQPAASAVSSGN